ncbi:MAG TPA: Gfo/Idh/MocA family oxidoreductase [Symbiobacteriaceae bacterium]
MPLRIGVVGAGGFGRFAMASFAPLAEVKATAVYNTDPNRARVVAERYGASVCTSLLDLVSRPDVDIVYVASPPAAHAPAVLEALRHGKHVWVEKPLATTREHVQAIARAAEATGLKVGIDYVLRFNPLYRWAVALSRSGILGSLRHMNLENDACDEQLPPHHWFWNPEVSGTILVEHGVHFFDIASQLAGAPGVLVYSEAWRRPSHSFADRVLAVTRYGDVPGTFYHAFDKPRRVERTQFRLVFDMGYVLVLGWMPVDLQVEAYVDEEGLEYLQQTAKAGYLPVGAGLTAPVRATLEVVETYQGADAEMMGRGLKRRATHFVRLHLNCPEGKPAIYARAIQAGMLDFIRSIQEPDYTPEVTLQDAIRSVSLALDAVEHTIYKETQGEDMSDST